MTGHGELLRRIRRLNEIGKSLSREKDRTRLLESILLGAKELSSADGGTLYTVGEDQCLHFEIVRTDSLGLAWGGTSGNDVQLPSIPLYNDDGTPHRKTVATSAVHTEETINIADSYEASEYDFSGTRQFDTRMGYRSRSFLTVPLKNHDGEVIGVLQLINAQESKSAIVRPFNDEDQHIVESLASQAAITMTNHHLIDTLNVMLERFIHAIAGAIDAKSPYTGDHCRRVPVLTSLIAEAINETQSGPLKEFFLSEKDQRELQLAAWLHDCGKVVTPVHVVDKASRLETIADKIHLIDTRFEVLRRDLIIEALKEKLEKPQEADRIADDLKAHLEVLLEEQNFLRRCNSSSEVVDEAMKERIHAIGYRSFIKVGGARETCLLPEEEDLLSIPKGTLSDQEREVINNHVTATINILDHLSYPKDLKNIPEIAGAHHERVDGKGYPQGLSKDEMSVQARVLAVADIFEALTSRDRPYKKAIPLSKALDILKGIKEEGHIDPDIYNIFIEKKVYKKYGKNHLLPEQMDV